MADEKFVPLRGRTLPNAGGAVLPTSATDDDIVLFEIVAEGVHHAAALARAVTDQQITARTVFEHDREVFAGGERRAPQSIVRKGGMLLLEYGRNQSRTGNKRRFY